MQSGQRRTFLPLAGVVSLALVCVGSAANGATPTNPPPTVEAVIESFSKAVAASPTWDKETKAAVQAVLSESGADDGLGADAIPEALCRLYPDYAAAAVAMSNEDPEDAEKGLRKLAAEKTDDPYLAAYVALDLSRLLTYVERYEDALPLLSSLADEQREYMAHAAETLFMLAMCKLHLQQREEAGADLVRLMRWFGDSASGVERYVVTANQVLMDLSRFREGSLTDIHVRMDDSRRLLALRETGGKTQEQQKKIVELIDKLLEEAEPPPGSSSQGSGQPGEGQPQPGQGQPQPGSGQPQSASGASPSAPNAASPAADSNLRGGQGSDHADGVAPEGDPADDWRRMPARERDKVLEAVRSKYPERYRDLVEQYYRGLQELRGD